mmetsp:Transcript_9107/g.19536  ORF Transcript_9107/g.19536 Transcript_9107/m.19536 type:complete len:487 (-) Transcript_9107:234-1694(-)
MSLVRRRSSSAVVGNTLVIVTLLGVAALLRGQTHLRVFNYLDEIAGKEETRTTHVGMISLPALNDHRIPPEEERNRYQIERGRNDTVPAHLRYRGVSGLGHRLARMSGAYHMAKVMNRSRLYASWGWNCGPNKNGDPDIFDNLFGAGPLIVDPLVSVRNEGANVTHGWLSSIWWTTNKLPSIIQQYTNGNGTNGTDEIRLVNDVPGYAKADLCPRKNSPIHRDAFLEKLLSDVEFFHQLRVLFRFNHLARDFMQKHRFDDHVVIGLHVRAGNGETGEFQWKIRTMQNLDFWLKMAAKTLNSTLVNLDRRKPPLVFLATDTPSVIDKFSILTKPYGIPVVTFPQEMLKEGSGASFNHKWQNGTSCHQSWVNQFMDATLLSASDVVVAGRYSSFTQTVALTTMLAGSILGSIGNDNISHVADKKLFCELTRKAQGLTCYATYKKWLYAKRDRTGRRPRPKSWLADHSSPIVWVNRGDWHTRELHLPCW